MDNDRKRINIMTSCNDNLTDYIFIQIRTMAMHLKNKEIYFYLFHNKIPSEKIEKLRVYCECFDCIMFEEVFVEDVKPYEQIAINGAGSRVEGASKQMWPSEAYFTFGCQNYLPKEVDRILYIDAGDVLFLGEIDEYYFDDFEGKSLIVSPMYVRYEGDYFTSKDIHDDRYSPYIKQGIFNSGSYMINVEMFRKDNISMEKFVEISEMVVEHYKENDTKYFGDQGILSIVFIDKMKYFKFPEITDMLYKPYNFEMSFYRKCINKEEKKLWYDPKIIHFVGDVVKPWDLIRSLVDEGILKRGETMSIIELLEVAAKIKYGDFMIRSYISPEFFIIEKEMIPFYEYWFGLNNIVNAELAEIFA